MNIDTLKHAQRERVLFLDQCITWRGQANRKDLTQMFDISTAQAAVDFRLYLSLSKTPPIYDAKEKRYFAAPEHVPLTASSTAQAFSLLKGGKPSIAPSIPLPSRRMDHKTMSFLFQAIRSNQDIQISYTSMHSGDSNPQWIGPSRFHFDGASIYLRAWSYKHKAYRDYLPIRIEETFGIPVRYRADPLPVDADWNRKVRLWIRPRTELTEAQARVVRLEYGFEDASHMLIETRKALEFYVIKHWGLGEDKGRLELEKIEELDT